MARPRLESAIENTVVAWCRKQGILNKKLDSMHSASWPDRVFFIPGGRPFFIEFKRVGGKLTAQQEQTIAYLLRLGYDCGIHDDSKEAIEAIKQRLLQ
jgi:hypothetical protein